jgi:hypothetical protein
MYPPGEPQHESFNPWSVVNLVFQHLADQGLHPILGEAGDPGAPASELLRAFGIRPAPEGNLEMRTPQSFHPIRVVHSSLHCRT